MFILLIFFFFFLFNVDFSAFELFLWKKLELFIFFYQFTTIYLIILISLTKNYFKKLFITLFLLVLQVFLVGYYQLEVFGWFLVINELTLGLAFFLILLHLNYPHTTKTTNNVSLYSLAIVYALVYTIIISFDSSLWIMAFSFVSIEWYSLLEFEHLNDLACLYYVFYVCYPLIILIVGVFLFFLSVVYLYSTMLIFTSESFYYKKENNTKNHTLKTPSFKKFKFYNNDL